MTTTPTTTTPSRRQRSGARVAAYGGYLWLLLVIVCVGAMSWTGLVRFGKDVLGMPVPLCYGVPVALDGLAVTLAFFALYGVLSGGAAGLPRLLAILVVCASSGFNYWQARQSGQGGAAELFFAGMSILTYTVFEVILRHQRREHLAELGAIEPPLARFRVARWLRFPLRTFRAWSAAIDQGLTDPKEALVDVRRPRQVASQRGPAGDLPERQDGQDGGRTVSPGSGRNHLPPPDHLPALVDHGPRPTPLPASAPAQGRPKNEDARRQVRAMLLEHGDALTGRQVAEATGLSRSRGQQLIVSEKAALAARNGSTP